MAAPASLTDRQREVKDLLDEGMGAVEIAEKLGVTRNAIYQQIRALRNKGALPQAFTPSGEVRTPAPRAREMVERITGTPATNGDVPSPGDIIAGMLQDVARAAHELKLIQESLAKYVEHPSAKTKGEG